MWAAYRNEDEPWRRLELPFGLVRLTDRVMIATIRAGLPPSTILEVQHLTADQVAATYTCSAGEPGKTVHATVSGLEQTDEVYAMLGSSIAFGQGAGQLRFDGVPAGPLDLVATRRIWETNALRVPRVIVRRSQDIAFNASLAPVDFASAEAATPVPHTITFTETAPATSVGFQIDFITASDTRTPIGWAATGGTATGYSLPTSILVPGDRHLMGAAAFGPGLQRSFAYLYASGADRTFSFGPEPNAPVFRPAPAGVVVRASVVSQPEYAALVRLSLGAPSHAVELVATREYFGGTPETWTLDVPDLRGVPGFQASWSFPQQGFDWLLMVTGQPSPFDPRTANVGELFRTAQLRGSEAQGRSAIATRNRVW
jgi:hypothetical protein